MYKIIFYEDNNGESEIKNYMKQLQKMNSKDARLKFNKMAGYINMLSTYGLSMGKKHIKHLVDDIWELRPLRDRILFAYWNNNSFILLSIFMKKTRKTPKREIEKAKRNLESFIKRGEKDG
ncbi:MAG: type II toxin-antitoxin system RelE/ParE family toxin [Oscillospiraceae bacterium]|nr:type II toxin-antitoxin system RelE/ParE family toxin [Oscillospiraceae bacterium]